MLARPLPREFDPRTLRIPPGGSLATEASRFRDALVVVARGIVEVETRSGARARFWRGDVLALCGLDVRAVHNRGCEAAVLVTVSRRRPRAGSRTLPPDCPET